MIDKIIPKKINFHFDIKSNNKYLIKSIFKKNILVIGGAGTIGSHYIKQLLKFNLNSTNINQPKPNR